MDYPSKYMEETTHLTRVIIINYTIPKVSGGEFYEELKDFFIN